MDSNTKDKKAYPPTVGVLELSNSKCTFQFEFPSGNKSVRVNDEISLSMLETFKIIKPKEGRYQVQAVRGKKPDGTGSEVKDIIPSEIPLGTSLQLYKLEDKGSMVHVSILVGDKLSIIQLPIDHPVVKYKWAIDAQLKPRVILSKQFSEFDIKIDDTNLPKELKGTLSAISPAKEGYKAILKAKYEGKELAIECQMANSALWDVSIAGIHNCNVATLSATIGWNEKYKKYEVSKIDPPWEAGLKEMFLLCTKTKEIGQDKRQSTVLQLGTTEKNLSGLTLDCYCNSYELLIKSFKYDREHPIIVAVNLKTNDRKIKVKAEQFRINGRRQFTALVKLCVKDETDTRNWLVKLQGLGSGELEVKCQLNLPKHIKVDTSKEWLRLPLRFKENKIQIEYADKDDGTPPITGEFRSEIQSNGADEFRYFSVVGSDHDVRYCLPVGELYKFGVASVEDSCSITMTVQKTPVFGKEKNEDGTPKRCGSQWEIVDIPKVSAMTRFKEPQTISGTVVCNWSAFFDSDMTQYKGLLSGYYTNGALLSLHPIDGVSVLLPVSARLLRAAGYYTLTPQMMLELKVRENSAKIGSFSHLHLGCLKIEQKEHVEKIETTITAKCLGLSKENSNTAKNEYMFRVETTCEGGPPEKSELIYDDSRKKYALKLTSIPNMVGAVITAITSRSKGKYYISQIIDIRIEAAPQ